MSRQSSVGGQQSAARNLEPGTRNLEPGTIAWRSPSNIALVKYWGKRPVQIPANPSLSMTLRKAFTETTMEYRPKEAAGKSWIDFRFDGQENEKFGKKIELYFQSVLSEFPFLTEFQFIIKSHNTFPHSTGIASSASSMSALGLCLAEFLVKCNELSGDDRVFFREASRLSRLASGSACRSVYGGYTIWGKTGSVKGTSNDFAVPVPFEIHPAFKSMKDAILVVSSGEKEVSSRAGHGLMDRHPFAGQRYKLARQNVMDLSDALITGDTERFIRITESEALMLHALMMTSQPSFILFQPKTISIINKIRQFRKEKSVPVCFTLDAGPNVHLLYPSDYENIVKEWIKDELVNYCENGQWIDDEIGPGPEKLK
jgi:diphosphomevalonate decarboxylase